MFTHVLRPQTCPGVPHPARDSLAAPRGPHSGVNRQEPRTPPASRVFRFQQIQAFMMSCCCTVSSIDLHNDAVLWNKVSNKTLYVGVDKNNKVFDNPCKCTMQGRLRLEDYWRVDVELKCLSGTDGLQTCRKALFEFYTQQRHAHEGSLRVQENTLDATLCKAGLWSVFHHTLNVPSLLMSLSRFQEPSLALRRY